MQYLTACRWSVPVCVLIGSLSITGCYRSASRMGDLSHGSPHRGYEPGVVTACGEGGLTEAGERVIHRRPYLQQVTDESVQLMWTAERAGMTVQLATPDGTVVHQEAAAEDQTLEPVEPAQYLTPFAGLRPGAVYCYEIRRGDEVLVRSTGFRTAPGPDDETVVRLALMGDLGTNTAAQRAVREQIEAMHVDLALIAGDIAYEHGKLQELEDHYFAVYEDLLQSIPFFVASGNHDYATDDAAPFRQVFSLPNNGVDGQRERFYSFDWGPAHVVMLDTERITEAQVAWLEADLARTNRPWKLVVAHRPPYSSGRHGSDLPTREAFEEVFERHDVDLVISGHEHNYERMHPNDGVHYLVTGAAGRETRAVGTSDFTAHSERVNHFVYAEISGGVLSLYAIDSTGQVFDTARIERGPARSRAPADAIGRRSPEPPDDLATRLHF